MGDGSYSFSDREQRAYTRGYTTKSAEQIFTQREVHREMASIDISIRESRDSEEHPDSKAIMICLDETGSMGQTPHQLIRGGLPNTMKNILERGVRDPQIMFLGIGDHKCDRAPLQIGQFESSDEKMDYWLEKLYLEGNGGGNGGESYMLAWYFAARHTSIDCFEKRGKKGVLITIGDEPVHRSISGESLKRVMGKGEFEAEYSSAALLAEAQMKYDVHHINVMDWSGSSQRVRGSWKELLDDEHYHEAGDHEEVATVISSIITGYYGVSKMPPKSTKEVQTPGGKETEIL